MINSISQNFLYICCSAFDSYTAPAPEKTLFKTDIISKIKQRLTENLEDGQTALKPPQKRQITKKILGLKRPRTIAVKHSSASLSPALRTGAVTKQYVYTAVRNSDGAEVEDILKPPACAHSQAPSNNSIEQLREEYNQLLKKLVDQQSEITRLKRSTSRNKEDNKSVTRLRGYCNRLSSQLAELKEENKKLKYDLHRANGGEVKSKPKKGSNKSIKLDKDAPSEIDPSLNDADNCENGEDIEEPDGQQKTGTVGVDNV